MDPLHLGEHVQAARIAAGLTQQQLCEQSGLSYSTLAKIERGAIKSPSIFTIGQIAQILGISIEELLQSKQVVTSSASSEGDKTREKLKSTPIEFVYSDINGVLVRFYQQAFAALAHDTNQLLDLVEQVFWRYNDAVCRGVLTEQELNKALAEALGVPKLDYRPYYIEAVEPITIVHEFLAKVIKRKPVGLLSNIFPGYIEALKQAGKIPDLPYKTVVDSSVVGVIKPDRRIFEVAEEQAGVSGEKILFIDDSRANIVAAQEFGWRCIWFDSYHPEESVADIEKVLAS